MARTYKHDTLVELAKHAPIPVINGLSEWEHPCQILADLLTIQEEKGKLAGLKLAYIGDGENNVAHSLALVAGLLGMNLSVASPPGYWLNEKVASSAKKIFDAKRCTMYQTTKPKEAVEEADVVYTDTWISMGDEKEEEKRLEVFPPYKVTVGLMSCAKSDAIFMHDLPAYRGSEVESGVIDGLQSMIFKQAENRLHAQKGLVIYILSSVRPDTK
jgi:ornithine carbamoyltransferase